jgi:hypothetical protein
MCRKLFAKKVEKLFFSMSFFPLLGDAARRFFPARNVLQPQRGATTWPYEN